MTFFTHVFLSGAPITEEDARSEHLAVMRYSIAGIAITNPRSFVLFFGFISILKLLLLAFLAILLPLLSATVLGRLRLVKRKMNLTPFIILNRIH